MGGGQQFRWARDHQPAGDFSVNPSLVGLWRFDEGSGTTVSDSSGLGNNGTLQGDNGNLPTWTAGQPGFGSALAFNNDGVNHTYVSIPASPSLQIGQTATNPWTITAWAYENSDGTGDFVSDYGRIMVIDGGYAFQLESGASGDGELYTFNENGDNTAWNIGWGIGSPVTPLLDQWEHWAVVYDGTNFYRLPQWQSSSQWRCRFTTDHGVAGVCWLSRRNHDWFRT